MMMIQVLCTVVPFKRLTYETYLSFFHRITKRCNGQRINKRFVETYSPVLVLRVVEHFINKRVTLEQILMCQKLQLHDRVYTLAGCTLHRKNHFCAIVATASRGHLWYDGLQGRLTPVINDVQKWTPSHVVYCQVRH